MNPESRIPNPESRIPNPESRIPNPESRILKRKQRGGFTLIELSIVLVIISLLATGVLVGQDLIRAAQLRSLYSDKQKVDTAVNTFKLKYDCFPGDCANATNYWGTDPNGCPTPGSNSLTTANNVPKTETCNGDGDKRIFQHSPDITTADLGERHRFWQQLANAGVIAGQFTGTVTPAPDAIAGGYGTRIGINSYKTSLSQMTFDIHHIETMAGGSTQFYNANLGHILVTLHETVNGTLHTVPLLTANDALNLDTKFDDGTPASGQIQIFLTNTSCTTSTNPTVALYNSSAASNVCILAFKTAF